MRHAVIDADGLVDNVILWDGETDYDPGDGFALVPIGDAPVGIGDLITTENGELDQVIQAATQQADQGTITRAQVLEQVQQATTVTGLKQALLDLLETIPQ